ncbi:ABC transporter ATP-binding protein [Nocardioides sp. GY 10127]|uniref:ABC transporter ATP-binding protein n=1 Tax=Nocardioides sp. GY 10127 TaxID=2569762 RepID=UPI0010A7E3DD|nr:ABC transporter ATP-binding protein [Nocardioides sp. GY 10127]TIC80026.1 ABC transporter ATP-binding protein [Nocardioides sp. GY 10127]
MKRQHAVEANGLSVRFPVSRSLGDVLRRRERRYVRAVDGVDLHVDPGEILAIVGESGSGKSTIVKALLGLSEIGAATLGGDVLINGHEVDLTRARPVSMLQDMQLIHQDPYESLDPRFRVVQTVREALDIRRKGSRKARLAKAREAMTEAHVTPLERFEKRFPHQLSGGQRQRVAIASALVSDPKVLFADEPVSMLDMTVRKGVLDVLDEQRRRGVAIVVVTHDLATVADFADRIAVMYLGRIVEEGPAAEVIAHPHHPYTQALVSVTPVPDPLAPRERIVLRGEVPDAASVPSGCRFANRCPIAEDRCSEIDPALTPAGQHDHRAACVVVEALGGLAPHVPANSIRHRTEGAPA